MQYKLLAAVVLLRLAAFVAASPITDDSNNQITTDDSSTNVDQVAYNPADPAADPAPAVDSGTLISQTAPSRPRATKVRLGPGDFKSFDLAIDDSVCQISTSGGGNVPFHSSCNGYAFTLTEWNDGGVTVGYENMPAVRISWACRDVQSNGVRICN